MTAGMETTYDRAAETAVLAACLISPTARAEAKRHITGSDFQQPAHEVIWDAITRLDRHKRMVDPVSVLALVQTDRAAAEAMVDVASSQTAADPDAVAQHAEIVRGWAIKRRLAAAAQGVLAHALQPDVSPSGYAATVANQFAAIRDSGVVEDVTSRTLAEVLADPDDEPDWLVPGLLERRDRLVLTGDEGLGKSQALRQIAICAAAGIDPWDTSHRFAPIKAAIFDCENTERQVRRAARGMVGFAAKHGRPDVADRVFLRCSARLDITRDKDLAQIHHELDALLPDLIVIGPLYKLVPRAIQTDDEAAPVLAALDTIRDRGIAMLIEAHSGHAVGKGGTRDMRPRGSSALLGWPEFGYGLRDLGADGRRYCGFVAWRGNRSERDFPRALRRADDGVRWVPYEGSTEVGHWAAS
jgi:RecA-family ATPase